MVKKQEVLEAVLQSTQPITSVKLWESKSSAYGWQAQGKTPRDTVNYNLSTLCREGKLARVKTAQGYAYCVPGNCGDGEQKCEPLKSRKAKALPKKVVRVSKVTKKPIKKIAKKITVEKPIVVAPSEQHDNFPDSNFDSGPDYEEPIVEQPPKEKKRKATATTTTAGAKRRKTTTTCYVKPVRHSFVNAIAKIFHKDVKEGSKISKRAVCTVDAIIFEQLEKISAIAHSLLAQKRQQTLDVRTCRFAIQMLYTTDLAKTLISESEIAIAKFKAAVKSRKTSRANRAGIKFSPSRVRGFLQRNRVASRFGFAADVYLAAAMDNLALDILDGAFNVMETKRKKRLLLPRDIFIFVRGDDELCAAISGTFPGAGVYVPEKK